MKVKHLSIALLSLGMICLSGCKEKSASQEQAVFDPDAPQIEIGDNIAIANTQYGKVRGYIQRGIYTYLGIPYGASTAGENRFMAPKEPQPWEGIKSTMFWGTTAPQNLDHTYDSPEYSFRDHWNFYDVGEDCLKLNVWTPKLDNEKRPVLVWLHGGGYVAGSGIEQDGYDGENISRYGNVVYVSINHRLGTLAFSDFSGVDAKFEESGNCGTLDMIAALKWVKNNIANFGGDPENVTIMGQSGGGAKVCTMVASPLTKGLVHKAVALSGNTTSALNQDITKELGKFIVKESGKTMEQLQHMPWREYMDLANDCAKKFAETQQAGNMRGFFGPIADGKILPKEGYFKGESSNNIPMIFCTTTAESSASFLDPELEGADASKVVSMLQERLGDKAQQVYDAYNKVFPNQKPIDVFNLINSNRSRVIESINAKAQQAAPVWLAWFSWCPPIFDGRAKAFHCLDISFWFLNTDKMISHTGGGKRPRDLSKKMCDALLQFMKTGKPDTKSLPEWPEYKEAEGATMMLDDECKVLNDPDREARASMQ
ncbi:MAG: carboxylesterase family protein [Bacteroidaceae bacterium]|nr:carboxylesterase family protein [Bacteroidaceae bacterium]